MYGKPFEHVFKYPTAQVKFDPFLHLTVIKINRQHFFHSFTVTFVDFFPQWVDGVCNSADCFLKGEVNPKMFAILCSMRAPGVKRRHSDIEFGTRASENILY